MIELSEMITHVTIPPGTGMNRILQYFYQHYDEHMVCEKHGLKKGAWEEKARKTKNKTLARQYEFMDFVLKPFYWLWF